MAVSTKPARQLMETLQVLQSKSDIETVQQEEEMPLKAIRVIESDSAPTFISTLAPTSDANTPSDVATAVWH